MNAPSRIILPHDVQSEEAVESPPAEHGMQHSAPGFVAPRLVPTDAELDAAAEISVGGNRIAMLVGRRACARAMRSRKPPSG